MVSLTIITAQHPQTHTRLIIPPIDSNLYTIEAVMGGHSTKRECCPSSGTENYNIGMHCMHDLLCMYIVNITYC